jgi:elongation factor G
LKEFAIGQLRNCVLVGHGGSGKTSLAEAMLWNAGAITRMGTIGEGTTTLDSSPDEIRRKVSINLGLAHCEWRETKINLVDTPGYDDFFGEVKAGIRVADAALVVVNGHAGVESGAERVWEAREDAGIPALIAVNMLDKEHSDFERTIAGLNERLSEKIVPLALPIGKADQFQGIVDLFKMRALRFGKDGKTEEGEIPAELKAAAEKARERMIDAVAEYDDTIIEDFLAGKELSQEEILGALQKAVLAGGAFPALPVSATHNLGIRRLLDAITVLVPSPSQVKPPKAAKNGQEAEVKVDPAAPLVALCFKTLSEPHVGDLTLIRVFGGALAAGTEVWNTTRDTAEKLGTLYTLMGKERAEMTRIPAGDFGAAVKLKGTHTGDTLSTKGEGRTLPGIRFPEPTLAVAIAPKSKGDEEKIGVGLAKLHEEDPTFRTEIQADMHQQVIYGMGEMHLDVLVEKLKRKYQVEVELSKPRVPYRETLKGRVEVQGRYKKQTGGRGQYGDVWLRIEPLPRGSGFQFEDAVVGGVVPGKYIPAVEKGIAEAIHEGVIAGYPVVDFKATLYDGSYHSVDSSEMAFKIAASMGFKKGAADARPTLLEPIMDVEVLVPDDHTGDVMGDLSSKRGKILGMAPRGKVQSIRALVPLAELYKYATKLRSLTQGRGHFSMKFSTYEEVPREQAEKIIEEAKAEKASS